MSGTNIKIYKNDWLLHDCTLCQNPDGRIGWWDAVDGTFHHREEEPTIREPMWAQYIDTGVSVLRKQIVPDTNVLTNADHIRSMTDEELAELLSKPWCENYRLPEECARFDTDCEACVMDWLCKPAEVTHE